MDAVALFYFVACLMFVMSFLRQTVEGRQRQGREVDEAERGDDDYTRMVIYDDLETMMSLRVSEKI
jgi:hypothetical protein